jgi:putative cell wall-binding protein
MTERRHLSPPSTRAPETTGPTVWLLTAAAAAVMILAALTVLDAGRSAAADAQETGECLTDQTGDVADLDTGEPATEPRADLIEHCVHFGPTLAVSAEVAQPTDPEEDPNWRAGTFVGWFLDVAGDDEGDFFIDFSLSGQTAELTGVVRDVDEADPGGGAVLCDASDGVRASVSDGVYHVSGIPPECVGGSDDASVNVATTYDTTHTEGEAEDDRRFVDTHPAGGEFTETQTAQARTTDRLAGAGRIQTAVEISQRQFPAAGDAARVYLSRGDVFADSTVGGTVRDGPILLTDRTGPAHPDVAEEIARLDPDEVVALGGTDAIADETLADAADGRPTGRLAGATRIGTAAAISQHVFPGGADEVYLARADVFADAVAGGSLTGGPILLVPQDGPVPEAVAAEIDRLDPDTVFALGGAAAVSQAVLDEAAVGREQDRLAGLGRIETSVEIARHEFPTTAADVFLARADVFADAVVGGTLTDGPTLLVPSEGELPSVVTSDISRMAAPQVTALGGPAAISDGVLTRAAES